ncbi:Biogenesis of lysosome-related organelles complex 1 subunit 5 [Nymphon striatum]|nr:Biogenesis of lysosome-related organelles complex 1 subunit 5 [Nymphon striatum]
MKGKKNFHIANISPILYVGEVYGRLFDHRAFLHGEQKFFLREFEEKRQDREIGNLFNILEKATEIKETELERVQQNFDLYLPNIDSDFAVATSMCEKIIQMGCTKDKEAAEYLQKMKIHRQNDWDDFIADIQDQRAGVDETFVDKEKNFGLSMKVKKKQ